MSACCVGGLTVVNAAELLVVKDVRRGERLTKMS